MNKKDFSKLSDEVRLLCYIYNKDDRKFINLKEVDLTKISGKVLLDYFTNAHPDKEYSSVVSLLPMAIGDIEKAYNLLEQSVKENKEFVAVYPAEPELMKGIDVSKMEYIGEIMDGALYLSKKSPD